MTLSEAIRLGSMLRPQAVGAYFVRDGSCALGAAFEAIGRLKHGDNESVCFGDVEFPIIAADTDCPVCGHNHYRLGLTITHLNDEHRWTREQIADWVESIERSRDAADRLLSERRDVLVDQERSGDGRPAIVGK